MNKPQFFVGLDVAAATFTSAVGQAPSERWQIVVRPATFANDYDSFAQYLHWLQAAGITPANSVLCMEATGVYGEVLAHCLVAQGYSLAVEPPLKVKRAFKPAGHKSDPVDSSQIAEYAFRFWDALTRWHPREELLEQIKTLLSTRELFVVQRTGHLNTLKGLKHKAVRTPLAEQLHEQAIVELKGHILRLEAEIRRLIDQDPHLRQLAAWLISVPGVGLLLAAHLLVVLQSAPGPLSPKRLAAFVGICPYQDSSGSSRQRSPTSRHYGPPAVRKLLFLAALSVDTHSPPFRLYFLRKLQEGKPKKVMLNNIANKLLKIMVAVVRSQTRYIPNYRLVNPGLLKGPLTNS